jgi:carbamoyl-phosphate synthase/aspartate carbamoyltransferase
VSTDYDEADKLYFENISLETILDIYQLEQSSGVLGASKSRFLFRERPNGS